MRLLMIAFLTLARFLSSGQITFTIGNYYRFDIKPIERYYKELKMGFDQEFYTPLVLKLKGNLNSCTIEEIVPKKEALEAKKYKEYKLYYEQNEQNNKKKKRKKKIHLLTPLRNMGYYTYNFVYWFDDNKHPNAITLNEVTLYDYNETELRNNVTLYALTWKNNVPEALYFQERSKKERNSKLCIVSFFDYYKKKGYTQHLHFIGKTEVDTNEKIFLKIDTIDRLMPNDSGNNKFAMQTMRKVYENGTSVESGFYILEENDTLFKFRQDYNSQGLLIKRIIYDRDQLSVKRDSYVEKEIFEYTYDDDGKPTSFTYKEGISDPMIFNLKFVMPDKNGNPQRMQVFDQYNALLREVGWYLKYKE